MRITLLAFGAAKDMVGGRTQVVELSHPFTVSQFRQELIERYPLLASLTTFNLALNESIVTPQEDPVLASGDEIAILPPVSGG